MKTRTCNKCHEVKALAHFYKAGDDKMYTCRDCLIVNHKRHRQGKLCCRCESLKEYTSFKRDRLAPDGYASHCKDCADLPIDKRKKKCPTCKEFKGMDKFDSNPYAGQQRCIACEELFESGRKKCFTCNTTKSVAEFHRDFNKKDKLNYMCRTCVTEKNYEERIKRKSQGEEGKTPSKNTRSWPRRNPHPISFIYGHRRYTDYKHVTRRHD